MQLQVDNIKPKKTRQLTRFMAQEMLYDYVSGALDRARHEAVEEYIPTCRETMRELERLRRGVDYARGLAQIQVPEKILRSIESYEPRWKKFLRRVTLWSAERGWRYVAPVFVFLTLVLAVVVWSPWQQNVLTELARVDHTPPPIDPDIAPQASAAVEAATAAAVNPAASPLAAQPLLKEVSAAVPATSVEATPEVGAAGPTTGAVYRASFEVTGLVEKSEALRTKIMELGGEMRPKGEKIFDLTLPESKLEEFQTYLATFGPVRLKKDKRPQEMPAGRIRIILLVNEKSEPAAQNAKPAEESVTPAASSEKPATESPAPAVPPQAPVKDGSTNEGSSATP